MVPWALAAWWSAAAAPCSGPSDGAGAALPRSLWSGLLTWDSTAPVPPASSSPVLLVVPVKDESYICG